MEKTDSALRVFSALMLAAGLPVALRAQELVRLPRAGDQPSAPERVVVIGRADDLLGVASSASEGVVSAADLATRPVLRPAEIVETIPGVIVTQHSGSGKANQYFLRGYNLDHGTDLATDFEGVPINLRSHAHGQGYTDLNFLIPELVSEVGYKKGTYYAEVGDFGSAGAFSIHYFDALPGGGSLAKIEGGEFGYGRGLFASSPKLGLGHLLYALELLHNDGPWDHPDDYQKINGLVRYSLGDARDGASATAIAYHGDWNSTDQVPRRAFAEGIIGRYGALDPSDGGDSSRYSLSAEWHHGNEQAMTRVLAYGYYYDLNLFSNFTYFLEDPVHGDQFEQKDRRVVLGLAASQTWNFKLFGFDTANIVGLQERTDFIRNGLFHSERRVRLGTTREDRIIETSVGPYLENKTTWTPWLRTVAGVRGDVFNFDVSNRFAENSGNRTAAIVSPKLSVILGPWRDTELYLNGGFGFHSNDARGVLLGRVAASASSESLTSTPANALVKTKGAEIGARSNFVPHLQSSLTLWLLESDSELVFSGDAGTTEPSRPSRRYGVEWANFYTPTKWLTADADFAWSDARFRDDDPVGNHIPGSIEGVVDAGVAVHDLEGWLRSWSASVRLRYFGPRSLIEDNSAKSRSSTLLYAQLGYEFNKTWSAAVDVFNVFDTKASDIDYFYASRLAGEPAEGVNDIHTHPVEPRAVRASVTARF